MKRSQLTRRTPLDSRSLLKRGNALKRSTLRRKRKPRAVDVEPGATEYKRVIRGVCGACGATGPVRRHHVVLEHHVRDEHGNPWDLRNALWVGVENVTCRCHRRHHDAVQRIAQDRIPRRAIEFAIELFGSSDAASVYFDRYYALAGDAERTVA